METVTPPMRRALLVDNDSTIRRISQQTLERAGFQVDAANTGVEALVTARAALPHVVVMETQLRDVPAYEAVSWLRSNPELAHVPVIMIAAGDEGVDRAIVAPGTVVRKPLSPQRLRQALCDVLGTEAITAGGQG